MSANSSPFYDPIYKKLYNFIRDGKLVQPFYDDRGLNIVRNLQHWVRKNKNNIALDLGCGLGQTSFSLSRKYTMVVATDISMVALKVLTEVAKRRKIKNICPILCDATYLPFKNEPFDTIICSGVLEWIPVSHDVNPTKIQIQALSEIRRVLGTNGILWLGIENRMSINYLIGRVDHHSGIRGITFLPRFIANYYSKFVKNEPYKTYLYNYWELRKLIRISGLDVHKSLTAFPYYSNPKIVCEISDFDGIRKSAIQMPLSSIQKALIGLISKTKLTKLFLHSFILICRKPLK